MGAKAGGAETLWRISFGVISCSIVASTESWRQIYLLSWRLLLQFDKIWNSVHWSAPHSPHLPYVDKSISLSKSGLGKVLIVAFRTKDIILGPGPQNRFRQERSKGMLLSDQFIHTLCIASSAVCAISVSV